MPKNSASLTLTCDNMSCAIGSPSVLGLIPVVSGFIPVVRVTVLFYRTDFS